MGNAADAYLKMVITSACSSLQHYFLFLLFFYGWISYHSDRSVIISNILLSNLLNQINNLFHVNRVVISILKIS